MTLQNAFEELATESKQDEQITRTEEVRDRLPEELSDEGGLKVALLNPTADPETGLATEDTLQAVRDRLAAVLAPDGGAKVHVQNQPDDPATETTLNSIASTVADLATQATSAAILVALGEVAKDSSVDGVESALSTLNGKDFSTHAEQVAISAILTQIAANTSTAAVEIADLELTAEQVNLNTDALEALLTTLNAKDFATQATLTAAKAVLNSIDTKLGAALTVTGPLTDTQLRAAAVAVSGPLTDAQLRASAVPVSGPLTDTQLRNSAVPVSGPLTDTQLRASAFTVDTELPPAAALSDTDSNPTTPTVGAAAMLWDSAAGKWVRVPGTAALGQKVDTELPAAAALSDALSRTPTVPVVGAALLADDGTNYGRVGMDSVKRLYNLAWITGTTVNHSSDSVATNAFSLPPAALYLYDGSNYVRSRANVTSTLFASSARTASVSSSTITNYNGRGVVVTLDVTAASGTGGLQVKIEGSDANGKIYQLNATPTAVIATGTGAYELGPGVSGGATGLVVQRTAGLLPRAFRITITAGDSSSYTYSVSYAILL